MFDSAVHCAAARGHLDCVEALHEGGVDMWVASNKGDRPVHEAAMAKHNGITYNYLSKIYPQVFE